MALPVRVQGRSLGSATVTPPRIALAGPMGVGKSTVGRALAERLGVDFVDLDVVIGPAAPIFAAAGEVGFRARERSVLAEVARAHVGVLALGGGTVVDPRNVAYLRETGWTIVVLDAPLEVLTARVHADAGTERPLAGAIAELVAARAEAYARAGASVEAAGTVEDVVARILVAVHGNKRT